MAKRKDCFVEYDSVEDSTMEEAGGMEDMGDGISCRVCCIRRFRSLLSHRILLTVLPICPTFSIVVLQFYPFYPSCRQTSSPIFPHMIHMIFLHVIFPHS